VVVGAWLNLRKTNQVHGLVNAQHDDLVNRTDQLTGALQDAGVTVPPHGGARPAEGGSHIGESDTEAAAGPS
jgi:hypothetical protein